MASAPKMGEQLLLLVLSATCVQFVLCQLQPQQHQFPNPQPIAGQPSTMLPQGMPNMDPNMLQMGQPMIPPPQVVPQMQDTAGSVSNEDSDQNGPPGVAMEYKIHIEPGKEECFYQYVEPGATFYVSFQVLKGGDGKAGFAVRNPRGELVHPYQWKIDSDYQEVSISGGYYSVCIDNQFSRFAAKLVNLYITTFRYDQWEKYADELKEAEISVSSFIETLSHVDKRIQEMFQFTQNRRSGEARDFNLLRDNNGYVQMWSIAQCVAIVASATLQVYFVRKLFDTKNITGKSMFR
nr:EOG090X0AV2 [Artemia franciscana]